MTDKALTKEDRLAFLLRKTIADFVATEVKDERAQIFEDLIGRYDEDGTKQLVVTLPGGEAIATLTIAQPTPKTTVKDESALLDWVAESDPAAIEEVTTRRVSRMKLAELEKNTEVIDGDHYTADGEQVPGLVTTTAKPSSFSVKYQGGDKARARLVQAWKQGELATLDTGNTLPALSWTGEVQEAQS